MTSPLIAGNDITSMSAATRDILLNKEVIAVNQDRLGQQGRRVRDDGDQEVWSKPLNDGSRAVILFNRAEKPAEIEVQWPEIGLTRSVRASVRDLWNHKSMGNIAGRFAALVPAHGVIMVKVTP
jgi:alpha-galactosidase